jgi:hypothetical protein
LKEDMRVILMRPFVFAIALVVLAASCRDRDAEKRIAELESRLSELEGKKTVGKAEKETETTIPTLTPATDVVDAKKTEQKPEGPLPVLQFDRVEHDFGTINEGESVEHTFAVKNTGEAPLIIQKAAPSCGCTVPDWTKKPIPAGGTGFVKAKFDSSGKPGMQNKTITVTANTWPTQTVLRFKAMVTPKPKGEDGPVK